MTKITAKVATYSQTVGGGNKCEASLVPQKFSIDFVTSGATGETIGRSGNPGYLAGLPVLAGRLIPGVAAAGAPPTGGKPANPIVYPKGFAVRGADQQGMCYSAVT